MAKRKCDEPFIMLPRSLLESFAWRAASLSCRLAVDRVTIEHLRHAGTQNGNLIVRKVDFIEHGIYNDGVAPALREACALGFLMMTVRGRAGNAEHRSAHQWALTFIRDKRGKMLSTTWKRFQSLEDAEKVAAEARAAKDTTAVAMAKKRASRRKVVPFLGGEGGVVVAKKAVG
jgi:hypothetical protein